MGNMHKKRKVFISKGIIEDDIGRKFNIDFVGDNDDFVNISYDIPKNLGNDPIKDLLKKNSGSLYDICFIKNYEYLLVGCKEGNLHSYKRIINNKSNLRFEEIKIFHPHKTNIIQVLELQSGYILTLSSDASAKILEIELDLNSNSDSNNYCNEIQVLLDEVPDYDNNNNSAIELSSGNLIISQGFFINFFEKLNNNDGLIEEGTNKIPKTNLMFNTLGKKYHLTKKIFTNSDCISFVEIDCRIFAATQIINKTLQLYDMNDYSLVKNIPNIELNNLRNSMCLINKDVLAVGGNNGSVYLINLQKKQILSVTHLENCDCISCIKVIDDTKIVMGCQFFHTNNDIVTFKLGENNELTEVDRIQKVHNDFINDIKLVDKKISSNDNSFNEKYNLITIGNDFIAKLVLRKEVNSDS